MSKGRIGIILLLIASLALGIAMGEIYFSLYKSTMPPMAVSSFNQGTAHGAFLFYGAGAGIVIFVWSLLAMAIAPAFRSSRQKFTAAGSP